MEHKLTPEELDAFAELKHQSQHEYDRKVAELLRKTQKSLDAQIHAAISVCIKTRKLTGNVTFDIDKGILVTKE